MNEENANLPTLRSIVTQDQVVAHLIQQLHAAFNTPALLVITLSVKHLEVEDLVEVRPSNVRASYPYQMGEPAPSEIAALLHMIADGLEEGTIN